jgi:hypothetical protein
MQPAWAHTRPWEHEILPLGDWGEKPICDRPGKSACCTWKCAGCQWLTPVILATHEAEIRRIMVQSRPMRPYLEKALHRKGLVEWP